MFHDLRYALKLLRKEKAFTLAALATLTLCIGANTAIFSVLEAVVLAPLPYPEPEQLTTLGNAYPGVGITEGVSNSEPDYFDRREMTDVFDSVAETRSPGFDLGATGAPLRVAGQAVTPSFFRVLRAAPMLGHAFREEDATAGQDHFAILSYGLWSDAFGRDPAIVGKDARLNGAPYRIVGVMPRGFEAPGSEARIWVPLSFSAAQRGDDRRHSNGYGMIARLRPGVTLAYAQQRIDDLNRANLDRTPQLKKLLIDVRYRTDVRRVRDVMVKDVRPILYLLQGAVAFVLLIGCVNVANLLLVRSNVRMREWAIRFSLGAPRLRLARQLLTESLVLAGGGGLLGALAGSGGIRLLAALGTETLPRGAHIAVNGGVLLATAGVAILTGLAFGSLPVYHLLRRDLDAVFRAGERGGTADRRAVWTRSAMVVCQVSLAVVLLTGSGLLTLSFSRLLAVDPGFRPQHVTTAAFSLSGRRYAEQGVARGRVAELMARVRAIPGMEAAGITTGLPFSDQHNDGAIQIEGHKPAPGELPPDPDWNVIDSGYFAAMGIPLLDGRAFRASDAAEAPAVAVIDERLARRYWPKGGAIGAGIRRSLDPTSPLVRIVGVVGTVKTADLAETNRQGQIYFPYTQADFSRVYRVVARTAADAPALAGALRAELRRVDPEVALFDVKSMDERLAASLRNRRAAMLICLIFAALALALSALGIYGVLAYTVTQRTREFGVRMALGAGRADVLRLVVAQGMRLAAAGVTIGVCGSLALMRAMQAMLFHVAAYDPAVYGAALVLLLGVAAAASAIPALRALRVQPATALHQE
jgi:predicted permease